MLREPGTYSIADILCTTVAASNRAPYATLFCYSSGRERHLIKFHPLEDYTKCRISPRCDMLASIDYSMDPALENAVFGSEVLDIRVLVFDEQGIFILFITDTINVKVFILSVYIEKFLNVILENEDLANKLRGFLAGVIRWIT